MTKETKEQKAQREAAEKIEKQIRKNREEWNELKEGFGGSVEVECRGYTIVLKEFATYKEAHDCTALSQKADAGEMDVLSVNCKYAEICIEKVTKDGEAVKKDKFINEFKNKMPWHETKDFRNKMGKWVLFEGMLDAEDEEEKKSVGTS